MKQILLENCAILATENGAFAPIQRGYLGIDGDTICYLSAECPPDASSYLQRKDMSGTLLIPGLINCHCHCPMVLLRGVGSDLNLQQWLFEKIIPLEDRLEQIPNGIRIGSELAIMEMLASGITSFSDMYMQPEGTAEVVIASGIKANLCRPVQCFDEAEPYAQNFRVQQSLSLFDRYHNAANGRLRIDFCIHAEYTCKDHVVRAYAADCLDRSARMHLHLSETRQEHEECKQRHNGMTPAEYFRSMGVFDSPTAAAHCVWTEPHDWEIFQEKGVSPIHNPSSNMKLGSGFAPIPEMLDMGLNVTIGTDGAASNNNLNLLEELHLASVLHNGYRNDPTLLPPQQLLSMATVNGARLQGRSDTGCLQVGKKADIAALSLAKPHMRPVLEPMAAVTYQAQASDVCMTMVDGQILYENGVYLTMDADRIYHDFDRVLNELYH